MLRRDYSAYQSNPWNHLFNFAETSDLAEILSFQAPGEISFKTYNRIPFPSGSHSQFITP